MIWRAIVEYTKDDVLKRRELDINDINPRHFKYQGTHPDNQFWHGSDCFVPVLYKSQPFKLKVRIKVAE